MSVQSLSQNQQMNGDFTRNGDVGQQLDTSDENMKSPIFTGSTSTDPIVWNNNTKINKVRSESSVHTIQTDRVNENGDSMSGLYSSTTNTEKLQENIEKNVQRLVNSRMKYNEQIAVIQQENWLPGFTAMPNIQHGILVQTPNLVMITYEQYQELINQAQ